MMDREEMRQGSGMDCVAEYAKTGRSKCGDCGSMIEKGALRMGVFEPSKFHSGMSTVWHHLTCFFRVYGKGKKKKGVEVRPRPDGIEKFDLLSLEDQETVRKFCDGAIPTSRMPLGPRNNNNNNADGGVSYHSGLDGLENSKEFSVEYAKSNQSHCITCGGRIAKNEVRISQKDYTSAKALKIHKGLDRWHHVDCFARLRQEFEFFDSANGIPGISLLKPADRDELLRKLPKWRPGSGNANPFVSTDENDHPTRTQTQKRPLSPEEWDEEGCLSRALLNDEFQAQESLIQSCKQEIAEAFKDPEVLERILTHNNQAVPIDSDKYVERIADIMTFGSLEKCSVCKGQLVYKPSIGYMCVGYISEFSKCTFRTKTPTRTPFLVPEDLKLKSQFFANYTFTPRDRVILEEREDGPERKVPKIDKQPLFNHLFYISSEGIDMSKAEEIRSRVEAFGGSIIPRWNKSVTAIFSCDSEVRFMTSKMRFAEENRIPVISASFIHSLTSIGFDLEANLKKHLLSSWICFNL